MSYICSDVIINNATQQASGSICIGLGMNYKQ